MMFLLDKISNICLLEEDRIISLVC